MRMYGRRFVDRSIRKKTQLRVESRDAVLWAIDWNNRICTVKIQGSNELVAAHFPQNVAVVPDFMREGNAVRVIHRGGVRGFLEVTGHGMALPTAVFGDNHPPLQGLPDLIMEDGQVTPTDPLSMSVNINASIVRIDGIEYPISMGAFGYAVMDDPEPFTMSASYPATMGDPTGVADRVTMDDPAPMTMSLIDPESMGVVGTFELDAAPSGNKFRYDAFYVGTDGIITYTKGSAVSNNPVKPSIPANHIQIGPYILLWTEVTEITGRHIGMEWETPLVSDLTFTMTDPMPWATDEQNITVTAKDQYNMNISGVYHVTLYLIMGTGQIWSVDTGYHDNIVSQAFSGSSYNFKYNRNRAILESSPYFRASIPDPYIEAFREMVLIGEGGTELEIGIPHSQSAVQYLTPAANVNVDWEKGQRAEIIVDQDTVFTFEGAEDKDKLILAIEQDDVGGWTPTMPAGIKFGNELVEIAVDEDPYKRSYLGFIYHAGSSSYDLVANVSGYLS